MEATNKLYIPSKKIIFLYACILGLFAPVWRPLCFDSCNWSLIPTGGLWTLFIGQPVLIGYILIFLLILFFLRSRDWPERRQFQISSFFLIAVCIIIIDIIIPTFFVPEIWGMERDVAADDHDRVIISAYRNNFDKLDLGISATQAHQIVGDQSDLYQFLQIPKMKKSKKAQLWQISKPENYSSIIFLDAPSYQLIKTYTDIYNQTQGSEYDKQQAASRNLKVDLDKASVGINLGFTAAFASDPEVPSLLNQYFTTYPTAVIKFDTCESFSDRTMCFEKDRLIFKGKDSMHIYARKSGENILYIPEAARLDANFLKELILNPEK